MRAERFGSYSIVATLAGIAVLGALEVDDAVLLARAAAFVADGDVAVVVAAGVLLAHFEQRRSGSTFESSEKSIVVMKRRAGAGRLIFFNWHAYCSK